MKYRVPQYGRVFEGHSHPGEMAKFAASLWRERMADLEGRGLVTSGRVRIVDRYVRAVTEYEFLYPEAMAEGPTLQAVSGGSLPISAGMRSAS